VPCAGIFATRSRSAMWKSCSPSAVWRRITRRSGVGCNVTVPNWNSGCAGILSRPTNPVPDVLDWERATAIVHDARACAVATCYCRHKAEHLGKACDAPQDICLQFNSGAEFSVRHKYGRSIDRSEALDLLALAREQGLVQIADNVVNEPTYICNCCGCCCVQLQAINEFDLPG